MKFYMLQRKLYTQCKWILNNISMWKSLNTVKTGFMTDIILITEHQIRFNETMSQLKSLYNNIIMCISMKTDFIFCVAILFRA